MEKLQLHEIAGYLPYKLYVGQWRHEKVESYLLYGLKYSNYAQEWTVFIDDSRHGDYQNVYLKGVHPILRPMSDLTKEITHNGKKFTPVFWLEGFYDTLNLHEQAVQLSKDYRWVNQSDHMLIMHLIEWHFDIHNLIGRELAIDINTLNNE